MVKAGNVRNDMTEEGADKLTNPKANELREWQVRPGLKSEIINFDLVVGVDMSRYQT